MSTTKCDDDPSKKIIRDREKIKKLTYGIFELHDDTELIIGYITGQSFKYQLSNGCSVYISTNPNYILVMSLIGKIYPDLYNIFLVTENWQLKHVTIEHDSDHDETINLNVFGTVYAMNITNEHRRALDSYVRVNDNVLKQRQIMACPIGMGDDKII